jgi:hypothetical protein
VDVSRERKRPAFQFYPGDWVREAGLQTCSLAARGLWIQMICLMHEGEPYGHLRFGTKTISVEILARMVGETPALVRRLTAELEEAGVFSRLADGTMFSRRMVRDEHIRETRADGGKACTDHPTVAARMIDRTKEDPKDPPLTPPLTPPSSPPLSPPFAPPLTPPPAFASAFSSAFASSSGSGSGSASAGTAALLKPAPAAARSKRPIFTGQRLVVFEWQVDALMRMLGDHTDAFDLHGWFEALDQKARDSCLVIPQRDNGAWLHAQTLEEARRRGLPIAVAPPAAVAGKQTTRLAHALARIHAGEGT